MAKIDLLGIVGNAQDHNFFFLSKLEESSDVPMLYHTPLTFPTTEHYDCLNRYHVELYVNFYDVTSPL